MSTFRQILTSKQAQLDLLKQQVKNNRARVDTLTQAQEDHEKAREVVNEVTVVTQEQVKEFIEQVVTKALRVVFGEQYAFEIEYAIRRNKSEANLKVLKDGVKFEARDDEVGGGVMDTAAFALRIALWALADPKPEPVLILDEPGKWISRDKIGLFGQMLKEISSTFGIQVVMVSHDASLIEQADRAFEVTQSKGVSKVEVVA